MFDSGDYLTLKAKGDVIATSSDSDHISIEYYEYDKKTGEKVGPLHRIFVIADLNVLRSRLEYRIQNIDAMLVDTGNK